jgi:hypothetical protein
VYVINDWNLREIKQGLAETMCFVSGNPTICQKPADFRLVNEKIDTCRAPTVQKI